MASYQGSFSVFSTYVEVIPELQRLLSNSSSILHVCGGDPNPSSWWTVDNVYSPRMWRWSLLLSPLLHNQTVFSTYVEVILLFSSLICEPLGILHVCGGDPTSRKLFKIKWWYSPRMWRWSWLTSNPGHHQDSILHVCGGDPLLPCLSSNRSQYSPRMWRWSPCLAIKPPSS